MIRPEDEPGLDLDWYALDGQGCVAHFTTGGCGALPRSAAVSAAELKTVADYFAAAPEVGASIFNEQWTASLRLRPFDGPHRRETFRVWIDSAARGLYAFDYVEDRRRRPRPYRVVARPEVPITAGELPPDVRRIVSRTVLRDVVFARDDVIGLASLL